MGLSLIVESESGTLEVHTEGRIFKKKPEWTQWYFSRDSGGLGFHLSTPVGYFAPSLQGWRHTDKEQPKWSRPKRFMVTIEHGRVQGYSRD